MKANNFRFKKEQPTFHHPVYLTQKDPIVKPHVQHIKDLKKLETEGKLRIYKPETK